MLVEIPDLDVIFGVIVAFLLGLFVLFLYFKLKPYVNLQKKDVDPTYFDRLEYYERQLIDMKIRLDALDIDDLSTQYLPKGERVEEVEENKHEIKVEEQIPTPEIRNEILRVGFRNTVGRAPPNLQFLNQLVGPGGANYEVVKGMWEYINPESKFETLSTESDEKLQNAIKTYNPNFKKQEKIGLGKMQVALSTMFGMELTNIYTSADQCFTLKNLLGKGGTLSKQFEKFQNLTEVYENIALTPCYDLAAVYCAFTYLFEQEKYTEIFETVELDHVAVKEKYNNTSFVEFCF